MVTSTLNEVSQTRRELSVTVPVEGVAQAIAAALASLAPQVRVPGFRPGKVPTKLVRSRVGDAALYDEAVRQGLNDWVGAAFDEHDVQPVAQPNVEVKSFDEQEGAEFVVTFDVLPVFDLPAYQGVEMQGPEWELTEDDIDQTLEQLRERFAEVVTVDRGVQVHDLVTLTIEGKSDGEVVPQASAKDLVFLVPDEESDSVMDTAILGVKAGGSFDFTDTLGPEFGPELEGKEVEFHCEVSEVKQRNLPELNDDFAVTASEFDTLEELRADLREELAKNKIAMAHANRRAFVVASLTEDLEFEVPESLLDIEVQHQLKVLGAQAERSGLDFNQFIGMASGGDVEGLLNRIREESLATVRAQIFIDAIAKDAGLSVDNDDLTKEVVAQAQRLGRDPQEVAKIMFDQQNVGALLTDALRRKAIDHLMDAVIITNEPPALETLEPAEDAADGDAKADEKAEEKVEAKAEVKDEAAGEEAPKPKKKAAAKPKKTTKAKADGEDEAKAEKKTTKKTTKKAEAKAEAKADDEA